MAKKTCQLAGFIYSLIAYCTCLLYTSDAADERSSVDLGGRRILKKKTQTKKKKKHTQKKKKKRKTFISIHVCHT